MSDIFLSYAIEDREKAAKLAAAFEQEGWTVWWDPYKLSPGADHTRVITEELGGSKVAIVLWSSASPRSFFIRVLLKGFGRALIVPVLLERVELPFELSRFKAFDLSDWDGSLQELTWNMEVPNLLRRVRGLIAKSQPPAAPLISSDALPQHDFSDHRWLEKEHTDAPSEGDKRFRGVFISYRRNEAAAYAGRLYDRLVARFGRKKVFIDTENVGWGEDFMEVITAAAESCAVMIALISPRWSRGAGGQDEVDDYVRLEVATPLKRKIRVVPILIQGASMPAPKDLPEDLAPLARRNALTLSDARWERDVKDLIKSLENLL